MRSPRTVVTPWQYYPAACVQCQPVLRVLVQAVSSPSAPASQQAVAALHVLLDASAPAAQPLGAAAAGMAEEVAAAEDAGVPQEARPMGGAFCAPTSPTVAVRLVEAGAMLQLDALLSAMAVVVTKALSSPSGAAASTAGMAEAHERLRSAFRLSLRLVGTSPDACHCLLQLQQEEERECVEECAEPARCGTLEAAACLLHPSAPAPDQEAGSLLLLRLLQHCQNVQEEQEGVGLSWVAWAVSRLAAVLPSAELAQEHCVSPPCSSTSAAQPPSLQQHELQALQGVVTALDMMPGLAAGWMREEGERSLRWV